MNFIKKNIYLILIFSLAIFLRLNPDIFIPGYNYDELAIVSIAKSNFPFEILKNCANLDYHAPLYYLLIHPISLLKNEFIYLRIFNLIISLINIFVFYKIGKALINKKTGLIFALFLSVHHLQIMTVSLVKFYCLCFLLASISTYYFIKILKYKKGYFKFAIANIFFLLSSTLGFIFINCLYLILILNKKDSKNIIKSFLISKIGFILYFPILITQTKNAFNNIISPHGSYSEFSLFSFYNFLNDYISPFINYSCGSETYPAYSMLLNFIESIEKNQPDYFSLAIFIFFSLIPVLIFIFYAFKNIKRELNLKLFVVSILYIFIFIILAKLEITGFIPLYIYCGGFLLIILMLYSINQIQTKISKIAIIYLIVINLFISNYYPIKKRAFETIKIYNCFDKYFKENNVQKNQKIIMISGGRFLKEYYKDRAIIELDHEKMEGKFQREILSKIFDKEEILKANKKNIFEIIKPTILNNKKNKDFEEYFNNKIYKNLEKNEEIILSFHAGLDPFLLKDTEIENLLKNYNHNPSLTAVNLKDSLKKESQEIDSDMVSEIILSYSANYLIELLDKNLTRTRIQQYTPIDNIYYQKIFDENNFDKSTKFLAENTIKGWIFVTYKKE